MIVQAYRNLQSRWTALNEKWDRAEQQRQFDYKYPDFKNTEQLVEFYTNRQVSGSPEYYTGLRADPKYLNGQHLEMIYTGIQKRRGDEAARNYANMVATMPNLAPTNFLLALRKLERKGWQAFDASSQNTLTSIGHGKYAEPSAFFSLVAQIAETEPDKTELIRGPFLTKHLQELTTKPVIYFPDGEEGPEPALA